MRTKSTSEPFGSLSATAAAALEAIGPVWGTNISKHREMVFEAYTPLVASADNSRVTVHRDIAYGSNARQVLDVFMPQQAAPSAAATEGTPASTPLDVMLFVHGGAFIRGAKSANGHIYDNVPYWFANQGCIGVNVEYRLADEAPYPSGAEDVALAVQWVQVNIGSYGGNVGRIFLVGHSAGGTHIATLLLDPLMEQSGARQVAGAVLLSARLQVDVLPDNPNAHGVRAYFGSDESLYAARAPGNYTERAEVPFMVVNAQYENPYLDLYGAQFFFELGRSKGQMPRFVQMPKHNHTSLVAHFNSGEDFLGREILKFFGSEP